MNPEPISGYFLIDKPIGWTSFSAVNKIRFLFKHKKKLKLKVGHAGTLDPLATGLLIVCYGKMTKQIHTFQDLFKEYTGVIKLGGTTPSFDLETEIDQTFPVDHITDEKIKEAALSLTGLQDQQPPNFSAKRIDGQRAYTLARQGQSIAPKKHEIEVFEFETTFRPPDEVDFRIKCSKGTYIRSLAFDLGKKLESGGHLTSLKRTAIGEYRIENALTIDSLETDFDSILK